MNYRVTSDNGNLIFVGETVRNFRGEPGCFEGVVRGPAPGKSAKVLVNGREYYAEVWRLTVTPAEELRTCSFCGNGKPCDCGIQYADLKR